MRVQVRQAEAVPAGPSDWTGRHWAPGWKMTVFTFVMLPVVIALGFWQLDRAALKHGYEARFFDRMAESARQAPDDLWDADFMRVRLTGAYDPVRYFLVDNQVYQGQPGYWIVAVFRGDDGRGWLVNRGWIAAPAMRDALPDVQTPSQHIDLVGVVWPDTGMVPLLAEDPWTGGWPKRVQRLDIERMAAAAGDVQAVELRLESGQPGVDTAVAAGHDFKARVHEGYAVQWFGLAGVLMIGYIIYGFRRHE